MKIKNSGNIRKLFVGLNKKVYDADGKYITAINFDNAATTPPLKSCLNTIKEMSKIYASIGRGTGQKAELSTSIYNNSKQYILDFFNIKNKDDYVVIYVKNTTEGINKLANILPKYPDEIIISSRMEHHSNDLPWRIRGNVDYIDIDNLGRLNLNELEEKLIKNNGKVRYVSLTGASNVTGYINDINYIAKIVHKYNAKLIVDGAQLVPHKKVDMNGTSSDDYIDFLVFSSHKIYSPFGIGVIIGLKKDFENGIPDYIGGGTVELVLDNEVTYLAPPDQYEAGTPNFLGVVSLINALKFINELGYDFIRSHEDKLLKATINGLTSIPHVVNYGDIEFMDDRLGICTFNIENIYHRNVAEMLAKNKGISVRHGWFCAHPYCKRLMNLSDTESKAFLTDTSQNMPGMIRVSFAPYNTLNEVNIFLNAVNDISNSANIKSKL